MRRKGIAVWDLKDLHIHICETVYLINDIEMRCLTVPGEGVWLGGEGVPDISLGIFQHLRVKLKSKSQQRKLRRSDSGGT